MFKNLDLNRINGYLLLLFTAIFPLSRAVASIFMAYFSLYFIILLMLKKIPNDFFKHPLTISISLYISYMFLSNLWNGISDDIYGIQYSQWISSFGIAIYIYKNPKYIYKILSAFILGMFISELISYGMYFELWHINGKGSSMPVPFMWHIMYSIFLAVTAILLLNRVFSTQYNNKTRILLLFFFITVTFNLFISNGRTGQLAFVIAMFATFFIHYKFNFKTIITSTLVILSLISVLYNLSPNFKHRVSQGFSDIKSISNNNLNNSFGTRIAMIKVSPYIIKDHFLLGVGVGGVKKSMEDIFKENDLSLSKNLQNFLINNHLHNQYLQTLVEGGIIGIVLLVYLYYNIFKLQFSDRELKELSILFMVVYIVGSVGDPLLIKQFTRILFILFIGIFLGASLKNKANIKS